jgi:HPt (histidine-containing phosphotransfer) domain-containing protein
MITSLPSARSRVDRFAGVCLMEQHPLAEKDLPATDASALDRLKRFGGGKLLREMIALFLAAAPERIAAVRLGQLAADAPAAELALHSLKSSAAQLGAMRLQRLSERGERLAKGERLDDLPILIQELEEELARVRDWLVRARDEGIA